MIQSADLTTAIFQIRTLKQLSLYSYEQIILQFDPSRISPLNALEYFEIDACSIATLLEALQYIGSNLKHLKIRLTYENHSPGTIINPTIIDQWLSEHQISGKYTKHVSSRSIHIQSSFVYSFQ